MPRGEWSLEVCVRHLETWKGETGRLWLTTVVFLSAIQSHPGKKELSFHRFPKCESKKKKCNVKIRRDEGELFPITEHTRGCSLHLRVMITSQHLVGLKIISYQSIKRHVWAEILLFNKKQTLGGRERARNYNVAGLAGRSTR